MQLTANTTPGARREAGAHAMVGAALGLALSGVFALARGLADEPSAAAVLRELSSHPVTYGCFATCAAAILAVLGWLAGRQLDRVTLLATTDPLTVVSNRHTFEARLTLTVVAAMKARMPVALLVVDVDRLKQINDSRGHSAGDAALRSVARAIVQSCRARDLVARWGGDEFVVLMARTRADEALLAAERIRRALAGAAISVSVGVAEYDGLKPIRPLALFEAADRALYEAKRAGRDRTLIAARQLPKMGDLPTKPANDAEYASRSWGGSVTSIGKRTSRH